MGTAKVRPLRVCARGQAAVESALVLFLAVLLALGIVQLACLEQGRLLLDAAAFHAARAGSVWNGDPERMGDAARLSVLAGIASPTRPAQLGVAMEQLATVDGYLKAAGVEDGVVQVEVLDPTPADFVGTDGSPLPELDFDAPFGSEGPRFLSVRVRWRYELKIPLAQSVLFAAMALARSERRLRGADTADDMADDTAEEGVLEGLAATDHRYFVTLFATHRIRMQSAFYRRNLFAEGAR